MAAPLPSKRGGLLNLLSDIAGGGTDNSFTKDYIAQLTSELERGRLLVLMAITAQLVLVTTAIKLANVDTPAFETVLTLALSGFLVHHFLPAKWRMNFFATLSLVSIILVFGWKSGTWLLVIGGILIALCHLPAPFWIRLVLILAVSFILAISRVQILPQLGEIPSTIWPILGSMFMFRLAIYLYDLRNSDAPFSVGRAVAYFFMLPNVCFPLFPVVDYKALQRSSYNDDALRLYQTGVKWMLRGLVQLTIYKVIYLHIVIDPTTAASGIDAARYMVATFLLYLKISGLFHMIVGILHLYGFGLAETHHFYLFSSSFTDFWRRINIYWKDFIQKLVFTPVYFGLRGRGEMIAVAAATMIAFIATWLLHSYQWFWIRGEFPIVWADIVFWLGLGLIVLVNVLFESRKRHHKKLAREAVSLRKDALLALKIAATFAAICILWAIWSTPSLAELGSIGRALLNSGPTDIAVLFGIPVTVGILGACLKTRRRGTPGTAPSLPMLDKKFLYQACTMSLLSTLFIAALLRPGLLSVVSPKLVEVVKDFRDPFQINEIDSKRMVRGYYEDLGDPGRFNNDLGITLGMQPKDWKGTSPRQETGDATEWQYLPSTKTVAAGAVRTINRFGFRDREYSPAPADNTFRIALVGSSHDMGQGVGDDETYENVVEDQLNRELSNLTGRSYEILNFSLLGSRPTQKLAVIERRVIDFQPSLILYVASTREFEWMFRSVPYLAKNNLLDQFPFVRSALKRADVDPAALPDIEVLESKLEPYADETLRAVLERFRDDATSQGIRPALVLLEVPDDRRSRGEARRTNEIFERLTHVGRSARVPVLSLQGALSSVADAKSLWVAPWDAHTNAEGHRLLAKRLYALLVQEGLVPSGAGSVRLPKEGKPSEQMRQ